MLDTIPSWAVKLQRPIEVGVQWNVMGLTVGVLEAKSKEVVRKANSPGVKDLGYKCLMDSCECRTDEVVGADI